MDTNLAPPVKTSAETGLDVSGEASTRCVDSERAPTVDPAASRRAGVHASARGGVQSDGQLVYDELAAILIEEAERQERYEIKAGA